MSPVPIIRRGALKRNKGECSQRSNALLILNQSLLKYTFVQLTVGVLFLNEFLLRTAASRDTFYNVHIELNFLSSTLTTMLSFLEKVEVLRVVSAHPQITFATLSVLYHLPCPTPFSFWVITRAILSSISILL